jgi:hypothetical protein
MLTPIGLVHEVTIPRYYVGDEALIAVAEVCHPGQRLGDGWMCIQQSFYLLQLDAITAQLDLVVGAPE